MADVFSVAITYGAQTARGIKDDAEELVAGEEGTTFSIRRRVVYIETGDLTSVSVDSAITVDGTSYNITAIEPVGDGKLTRLTLVGT